MGPFIDFLSEPSNPEIVQFPLPFPLVCEFWSVLPDEFLCFCDADASGLGKEDPEVKTIYMLMS